MADIDLPGINESASVSEDLSVQTGEITLVIQPDAAAGQDTSIVATPYDLFNYGLLDIVALGSISEPSRVLLKFDLSDLPSDAIITSATLSLYCLTDYADNGGYWVITRLKRDWLEGTQVAAEDVPPSGATCWRYDTTHNWAVPGAWHADDAEIDVPQWICVRTFTSTETLNEFKDFILTPTTKAGLDLGYGWILRTWDEDVDCYWFASSDHATPAFRPKLVIVYTMPLPSLSLSVADDATLTDSVALTSTPVIALDVSVSSDAKLTESANVRLLNLIAVSDGAVVTEEIGTIHTWRDTEDITITDAVTELKGALQYNGDDSLGTLYHETKIHPHLSKWYLVVKVPRIIYRGTVPAPSPGVEGGHRVDLNDMTISLATGANVAGFDVNNFLPDLTVWVGSLIDTSNHGRCRLRHFNNSTEMHVSADGACWWRDGDYVTVTDLHELWPIPRKVDADDEDFDMWMDTDLDHSLRKEYPVPIFGPPACAFRDTLTPFKATVDFHGGRSFLVQGDSGEYDALGWDDQGITAWDWWLEGADTPTPTGKDVTALYSTAGTYVARLTVTGINGETFIGFRNVFIRDRTGANAPITQFNINRLSGSLDNNGWEAEIEVFDTGFLETTIPNGAQAVVFAEEWFGDTPKESFYATNYYFGRENIKMVGWLTQTHLRYSSSKVRNATMTVRGLQEYLKSYSNFSVYFTMLDEGRQFARA
jgi:hypothetical protein